MNIGLYFGSFNPIHLGHLIIAETILEEKGLDAVWFVVSPQNPFKAAKDLLAETDRFEMVKLALADNPRLQASDVEFGLPKPSYTIDTLNYLEDEHPSGSFSLIMGADNLTYFPKWKSAKTLLEKYPIIVFPRQDSPLPSNEWLQHQNIHLIEAPLLHISATAIRKRLAANMSIRYLVPEAVRNFILQGNKYA